MSRGDFPDGPPFDLHNSVVRAHRCSSPLWMTVVAVDRQRMRLPLPAAAGGQTRTSRGARPVVLA